MSKEGLPVVFKKIGKNHKKVTEKREFVSKIIFI